MGSHQPTGRTIGRTRRILTLAPCPVEGYPIGDCTPRTRPSTSTCSLRCSPKPHLDFSNCPGTGSFAKVLATTAQTSLFPAYFTLETAPDLDFSNSRKSLYTGMTAKRPPKRPWRPSPSPWKTEQPAVLKRDRGTGRKAADPGPVSLRGLAFHTPGFHPARPLARSDVAPELTSVFGTHRNQPFRQSARRTGFTSPFSRPFQLAHDPAFPFSEVTPIPVHGYDSGSRPFAPVVPKGRTRESSHMRHGVPLHGSPHSTAIRPTWKPSCVLTRALQRER